MEPMRITKHQGFSKVIASQDNRMLALNFLERMDSNPVGDFSDLVTLDFKYYSANPFGKFVRDLPELAESGLLRRPVSVRSIRTLAEDDRVCVQRVKQFDVGGAVTIPLYSVVLMSIVGGRVSRAKEYADSALVARLAETLEPYETNSVRQNFSLTDAATRDPASRPEITVDFLHEFSAQRFNDAAAKVTADFANWIPGYGWSNWAEIVKIDREFLGLYRFLSDPYPDGPNLYVEQIEANVARIRRELASRAAP